MVSLNIFRRSKPVKKNVKKTSKKASKSKTSKKSKAKPSKAGVKKTSKKASKKTGKKQVKKAKKTLSKKKVSRKQEKVKQARHVKAKPKKKQVKRVKQSKKVKVRKALKAKQGKARTKQQTIKRVKKQPSSLGASKQKVKPKAMVEQPRQLTQPTQPSKTSIGVSVQEKREKVQAKGVVPMGKEQGQAVRIKQGSEGERNVKIVNIVVSTSLGRDVPLERMAATFSNTEYNPEQFPGLVFRIKEPKTSALIFSSGRIVCTGAKSMEKVRESIRNIIENLKKIGVEIDIEPEINVQNIVAAGSIGMDLNLNLLAMKLENTEYEPEQFPGLVYKLLDAKATFLLFRNGKIVCTGTKSEEEVNQAIDMLIERLKAVQSGK